MKKEKVEKEIVEETLVNESAETLVNESQDENQVETPVVEELDAPVDELEQMTLKCAELNDKNLRLMAEFDNYRKRTLKERADLIKTAGESVLVDMLPLVDDFERGLKAMESSEDVQAVKDGVELIYSKFCSYLAQKGVKAIPTENENFDTEYHEAITTFPAPSEELKGKIIDCVSKGYTLHEKVIRFSKVVVGE
jgi:molecular chaperone GrpE